MFVEKEKIETRLMFNFRSVFDDDAYSLAKYLTRHFPESTTFGSKVLNLKPNENLPTILPKLILKNNLFEIRASKKSIELRIKERPIKYYTYEFIGRFNEVPELMRMQVLRMNYMAIFGKSYSDFINRLILIYLIKKVIGNSYLKIHFHYVIIVVRLVNQ